MSKPKIILRGWETPDGELITRAQARDNEDEPILGEHEGRSAKTFLQVNRLKPRYTRLGKTK